MRLLRHRRVSTTLSLLPLESLQGCGRGLPKVLVGPRIRPLDRPRAAQVCKLLRPIQHLPGLLGWKHPYNLDERLFARTESHAVTILCFLRSTTREKVTRANGCWPSSAVKAARWSPWSGIPRKGATAAKKARRRHSSRLGELFNCQGAQRLFRRGSGVRIGPLCGGR